MAYGISRAMIPPLHTSCWLRVLFPISFSYHKAVLGCPNLQRGMNGHTLVWANKASTAGLHGAYT